MSMEQKQYTDEEIRAHFFGLYDQMPEDYAILAKLRYEHFRAKTAFLYCGKGVKDTYHAIDFGFLWSATPELKFWYRVASASSGKAPYPIIPESSMLEIEEYRKQSHLPTPGLDIEHAKDIARVVDLIESNDLESTLEHFPAYISISPAEYRELKEKADRLDKIMEVLK